MKIQDAANLLEISGQITPDIVKAHYRRAAMKYHPDRNPAGLLMMQAVNAAYELLKNHEGMAEAEHNAYGEHLNEAINAVIHLHGIIIEVCGNWVWLSGETKQHKDIIKEAGYKWASVKRMWNYRPDEWKSANRKEKNIDEIRTLYGSQRISTITQQAIE